MWPPVCCVCGDTLQRRALDCRPLAEDERAMTSLNADSRESLVLRWSSSLKRGWPVFKFHEVKYIQRTSTCLLDCFQSARVMSAALDVFSHQTVRLVAAEEEQEVELMSLTMALIEQNLDPTRGWTLAILLVLFRTYNKRLRVWRLCSHSGV